MKKSQELMARMFDNAETPVRSEKPYRPPMWYYVVSGNETMMMSQGKEWIPHDLQHTIPLVFKSSVRAKNWAMQNCNRVSFKIRGSRFVEIGGIKVLNGI